MWSASSTACRPTTSWSILTACRPCLVPPNLLLPQNMRWQSWHDKLYEPPCCRWTCSTISTDTRWDQIWPIREWKHDIWRYDMTRILEEPLTDSRSISPWILTCSIPLCLPGCLRLGHGPVWNGWGEGCSASCQELPSNGWIYKTHWQRAKAHDAHDAHFQPIYMPTWMCLCFSCAPG